MAKTKRRAAAPSADDATIRKQYRRLVDELARRIGTRRGWQRRAAAILGVSPSMLSNVLTKDVRPGGDVLDRAAARLGFDVSEFLSSEDRWRSLLENRTARDTIDSTRPGVQQRPARPPVIPPTGLPPLGPSATPWLVTIHQRLAERAQAWARAAQPGTKDSTFDPRAEAQVARDLVLEILSVPFVRYANAALDEDASEVLATMALINFVGELQMLREWFLHHPDELPITLPTLHLASAGKAKPDPDT